MTGVEKSPLDEALGDEEEWDDAEPIPAAGGGQQSIWPLIAGMDYLLADLAQLSPMSAHLLRMSRQNLLDEFMAKRVSK